MKKTSGMKRRRSVVTAVAVACFTIACSGCGTNPSTVVGTAPEEKPISQILSVWVDYHRNHKKNATVADLKAHIKTMKPDQLERMKIKDPDAVFTSPRDNQPYTVVAPRTPMAGIVIYEKNGVSGKRMTASSKGDIIEMDGKDLEAALGKAP